MEITLDGSYPQWHGQIKIVDYSSVVKLGRDNERSFNDDWPSVNVLQYFLQYSLWLALIIFAGTCASCKRNESSTSDQPTKKHTQIQWFTDITEEVGLDFIHETGATGKLYMPEIMASGAALFDYDNDDDLDIFLLTGHKGLPKKEIDDAPPNRLYRQESNGHFTDVTTESGLTNRAYSMGVAIGDIDNDGDVDMYITNYSLDRLYRNRGDGTFEDITNSSGIHVERWSASAAFVDYDRDGFLDLFVTQYVIDTLGRKCLDKAGRQNYCGPQAAKPISDVLLHNNGDGTFSDVSKDSGIASVSAAGLGIVCEDFNEDGWIDIYVTNDAQANHLWINQTDGTFVNEALLMGCAFDLNGNEEGSMGIIAADFDNDLDFDLFLTHITQESNTLYKNLGAGLGFIDATSGSGLGWSSVGLTGFGAVAFDVELDGDLDIAVVNGRVMHDEPMAGVTVDPPWNLLAEPNLFYVNNGHGKFTEAKESTAAFTSPIEISRGLAIGDIDADGDMDMLITNEQRPVRLYRNDSPRKGHWLIIRTRDPRYHRDALGAKVVITCAERSQVRTIRSTFSYLSASEPVAHFGLGNVLQVDRIKVYWPDGLIEEFPSTKVDRVLRLVRGEGQPTQ